MTSVARACVLVKPSTAAVGAMQCGAMRHAMPCHATPCLDQPRPAHASSRSGWPPPPRSTRRSQVCTSLWPTPPRAPSYRSSTPPPAIVGPPADGSLRQDSCVSLSIAWYWAAVAPTWLWARATRDTWATWSCHSPRASRRPAQAHKDARSAEAPSVAREGPPGYEAHARASWPPQPSSSLRAHEMGCLTGRSPSHVRVTVPRWGSRQTETR